MLIARRSIATAITPHAADRSWVVFLQTALPAGVPSPIKIAAMAGAEIGGVLRQISTANAYEVQIIGLIPSTNPDQHAKAIADQYAGDHLHDGWYLPRADLVAFIQHHAKAAIQELLSQVHPAAIPEHIVDLKAMARILNCHEITVRRMVRATPPEIPFMRAGEKYLFHPAEVLAALQRQGHH